MAATQSRRAVTACEAFIMTVSSNPSYSLTSHFPIFFYFLKGKLTSKEDVSMPRTYRTNYQIKHSAFGGAI
jgi:hypothetical protein